VGKHIRTADAKLTALVITPAVGLAGGGETTGVAPDGEKAAGRNLLEGEAEHEGGRKTVDDGSVTELASIVASPAVRLPGAGKRAGMRRACVDTGEFEPGQDWNRHVTVRGRPVPELAARVVPPAKRRPVTQEGAGVRSAQGKPDEAESRFHGGSGSCCTRRVQHQSGRL
jgi:hypothetical protein